MVSVQWGLAMGAATEFSSLEMCILISADYCFGLCVPCVSSSFVFLNFCTDDRMICTVIA